MKQKGFAHIGIIILVIVVGLFFVSSVFYSRYNNKEQLNKLLGKDEKVVKTENKENRYIKSTPAIYRDNDKLVHPETYGYGTVFKNTMRSEDYLIYTKQVEHETPVIALNVKDRDSKEITLINNGMFSEKPLINIGIDGKEVEYNFGNDPDAVPPSSIELFDNLLLIKYFDYLTPSRLIIIDLNNLENYTEPTAIIDGPNYPEVKRIGNSLIYSTSFGDGCGYRSTWQRLNNETYELYGNKIKFSNYQTVHIMSDDEQENIIYANVEQVVEGFAGCPGVKLLSIHSTNLLNENRMLVSLENLLDDIHYFVTENKTVYLIGEKSLFKYDLYSTNVEKVGDFEFSTRDFYNVVFLEQGGICFGSRVLVDHTTAKTISEYSEKCIPDRSHFDQNENTIPNGFEELDLPEWFELR